MQSGRLVTLLLMHEIVQHGAAGIVEFWVKKYAAWHSFTICTGIGRLWKSWNRCTDKANELEQDNVAALVMKYKRSKLAQNFDTFHTVEPVRF